MNKTSLFSSRVFSVATVLAVVYLGGARPAQAQPAAVQQSDTATRAQQLQTPLGPGLKDEKVPMLYEGELEDTGPQYLLAAKPKHKWFNISSDFQIYRTDNATLAPNNTGASDVSVLTLQGVVQGEVMDWFGVQAVPRGGFRYQSFWYGALSGRDHRIGPAGGLPVKNNDFMTYTPFGEVNLQKGSILGSFGVRYAAFTNDNAVTSGTFYQEWVPYWLAGYQWSIAQNQNLTAQYDGDFRFTNSQSGGLQPVGWNDRTDHAFSLIYNYILGGNWVIQPSYRFQYSYYTYSARQRNDVYNTLSLVVAYYFNDWAAVRFLTSYEWRSSSELGNNYQNYNIGVGANLSYSF